MALEIKTQTLANGMPIEVAVLTPFIEGFLLGYKPKDDHFTSNEECKLVGYALELQEDKRYLCAIRNAVVKYYSEHRDLVGSSIPMMSVTAVIDDFLYQDKQDV